MDLTRNAFGSIFSEENKERLGVHYLGASLLLAWYYCLWFSPNIFPTMPITDNTVTYSWLSTLAISGAAFLILAYLFKGGRHVCSHPCAMLAAGIVAAAATLALSLFNSALLVPTLAFLVFPVAFGTTNGIMWIGWGEFHGRKKSTFSIHKFAGAFGAVMFGSIIVAAILPHFLADAFVAALPVASALFYLRENACLEDAPFPTLLPKATRKKAGVATAVISATIAGACAACYFNIAIIPVDALAGGGDLYVVGIAASGVLATLIALTQKTIIKNGGAYRLIPWLFVIAATAIALFASGNEFLYSASFVISVMLAGIFEMVLIAYFGTLSSKGQIATAVAFGVSSAVVRLGFFIGDAWAVFYESNPALAERLTLSTSLLSLCLLTACLIPLLRQEGVIVRLTTAPASNTEVDEICDAAIAEFSLSKREGEILKLFARGYTIDAISKKLVISPYTTQTHVRHIYSKMNVHKRSELLDYINMHRSE